jgi:GAF domain-containing protein
MSAAMDAERRRKLVNALTHLASVETEAELVDALRAYARAIAGADGIAVVKREGARVSYIAEDATGPLWTGQRFPIETCISGIAMIERRPILISDIRADPRVPPATYAPTFVRAMAMFPIGLPEPVMALGVYWGMRHEIDANAFTLLAGLARSAGSALTRIAEAGRTESKPRRADLAAARA